MYNSNSARNTSAGRVSKLSLTRKRQRGQQQQQQQHQLRQQQQIHLNQWQKKHSSDQHPDPAQQSHPSDEKKASGITPNHFDNVSADVSMCAQVGERNQSATDGSRQSLLRHQNQTLSISTKNRAEKSTSAYEKAEALEPLAVIEELKAGKVSIHREDFFISPTVKLENRERNPETRAGINQCGV